MAGRKSDFTLPTLDDLFSTQELRDDAKLSKIRDIPLELIDDFPDHPFKVRDDEDMIQLVESVKERGVITPATVRQKEDGRYELISGHRRKRACELAGFEALRCEVVDLDRDAATVLMVESNYQRSQILPSEKAFAYKMRLEAMKRQGQRSDLTSSPVGTKFDRSSEAITEETGDSRNQIHRYIRLTNLVPELLDLVDEGKIKMRPAVELSYLDEDSQRAVVDEIDLNQCTPSHDQTIRMRKFFTDGKLTPEVVSAIMGEEKPNQREKIVLRGDKGFAFRITGANGYDIILETNALRSEEYGLLQSRSQMVRYGRENKESEMQGAYTTEFGFRADTEKYVFVLRCNPTRGDYNFYCLCYVKEWLDKHIEEANRDIRFIDSHYKELFRIPDGERIIVTDRDGKTESYPCRYIDSYHTEVGRNLFHICEFAERMEQGGCTYAPMEPPLPPMCYSILPSTGEVIQIDRWQKGYTATSFNDGNRAENEAIKDKFNEKLGVSKAQEQAMLAGSMIRWDSIAAKPKSYP